MKEMLRIIKTTLLGGLLFLVPLAVLLVVLGKIAGIMRAAAQPFDAVVPVDSAYGVLLANLIGVGAIVVACFVAGLLAANRFGREIVGAVDRALLNALPGYSFVKGMADSMARGNEMSESFIPVIATFDDNAQIAFEVERTEDGHVVVYLPGAPNPWSGSLVYLSEERVTRLELKVTEAVRLIQTLGRGAGRIGARLRLAAVEATPARTP